MLGRTVRVTFISQIAADVVLHHAEGKAWVMTSVSLLLCTFSVHSSLGQKS